MGSIFLSTGLFLLTSVFVESPMMIAGLQFHLGMVLRSRQFTLHFSNTRPIARDGSCKELAITALWQYLALFLTPPLLSPRHVKLVSGFLALFLDFLSSMALPLLRLALVFCSFFSMTVTSLLFHPSSSANGILNSTARFGHGWISIPMMTNWMRFKGTS